MKKIDGTIASPKGFVADGLHCGLKRRKKDIGWLYSEKQASVAGVFTTNQVKAAPVIVTKAKIQQQKLQAIIINSGNANACTGQQGLADAKEMCQLAANALAIAVDDVAVASTGIIGQALPMVQVKAGIELLQAKQDKEPQAFQEAILTTDTCQKVSVYQETFNQFEVIMAGCAKGSGMIHPNMATMLGFVTTDANISSSLLQELLSELTEITFNQITIDGDTSTNDMVLVLANGLSGMPEIQKATPEYDKFRQLLAQVLTDLAKSIAKDGEGATKLIETVVTGAKNSQDARMLAKSVVGSSLVKSAIFGQDPNWGRILCALGYSGVAFDPEKVQIYLAETLVFKNGQPTLFDAAKLSEALATDEVKIQVILAQGEAVGQAWGCDLTYEYVKINALYHT